MIILQQKYIPTQAGVRRMQALARGVTQNGEKIKIIYLSSSQKTNSTDLITGVTLEFWGYRLSKISYKLGLIGSALHFFLKLPKEDIYYYGMNPLIMLLLLVHNRRYYHEFTEYPPYIFGNGFRGKLSKKIHNIFMKRCQHIFVISKKLKGYCADNGIPSEKVSILNMFVDLKRFDGIEKKEGQRYIAYCGNGENFKDGVDCLIEAFAIVTKKIPNVDLYIIGKGPQKDWDVQNSIIQKHNLQKRVKMLGVVKSDEIPQYLISAEVLALARPNNIQAVYGFPTKVGEYLSTGNPVVLTRVGELGDFLIDGENAIFADADNPADFAEKLCWLLENSEKGKYLGEQGRKVAEQSFSNIIEAQKVVNIIRR